MRLQSRLSKLEKQAPKGNAQVVITRTIYEKRDGSDGCSIVQAMIKWGYFQTACAERAEAETEDEFQERVDQYAKLTWQQAKELEGLDIHSSQL